MRTIFHPFLPNGALGDPLVWVDLLDAGHSLLLDLGDVRGLGHRKLLRVTRVFVTHTHMDHFIGFDDLLRVCLTRDRELVLTGPSGFQANVEGRLAGYTWNLIDHYPVRLRVEEIDHGTIRSTAFEGSTGLSPRPLPDRPFNGVVHDDDRYEVHAAVLDHGMPVLGFALREREHLGVNKDRLDALGLQPGPWLNTLKSAVRQGRSEDEPIEAGLAGGSTRSMSLGRLAAELLIRRPGQDLGYLTDLRNTPANVTTACDLVRDVHLLVCEGGFLHSDEALARERNHLTARQAGELARAAGAQRLALVHFSPRYAGRAEELLEEAARAFGGPVVRLPPAPGEDRTVVL